MQIMKILSIGNSFSQDAHKWLHDIAITDDFNLDTVNLFIGGCSLERHYNNLVNNEQAYSLEGNGGEFIKKAAITETLENDKYDIVTLQQVSGLSGKPETYLPYIVEIAKCVKRLQPQSFLYLHRTWSYEIDSGHDSFKRYDCDQKQMFREIINATDEIAQMIGAKIIPVGNVIQELREKSHSFQYKNAGRSLCRDGFHLSLDYGRFTAAAVWYKTLTGRQVNINRFQKLRPEFDIALLEEIMSFIE